MLVIYDFMSNNIDSILTVALQNIFFHSSEFLNLFLYYSWKYLKLRRVLIFKYRLINLLLWAK